MFGFGIQGSEATELQWTWARKEGVGNNRLWLGDADAGVFVTPRGEGDNWVTPTYGKDYPIYPFLPSSWAGIDSVGKNASEMGANVSVSGERVVARIFSGGRMLPATPVLFLFDMMFTPSRPRNLTDHCQQRYILVGYQTGHMAPDEVKSKGATVVTLHQGN